MQCHTKVDVLVLDHSNVDNLNHIGRKKSESITFFSYCTVQNIILGLRTEAVVNKGDGDTLSDWKPAFAWHRWNFCDHQDDQLFVVTKMINQKAVHEFCDDNKKRSYY